MKTLFLALLLSPFAQSTELGVFYALSEGNTIQLEHQTPVVKTKSRMFSSSAKGYVQIDGKKSPVRFSGDRIAFVVHVSNQASDPIKQIRLLKLESKDGVRRILVSEVSAGIFSSSASTKPITSLPFTAEKHGPSAFKITIRLEPGEYAFDSVDSKGLFCFGVD